MTRWRLGASCAKNGRRIDPDRMRFYLLAMSRRIHPVHIVGGGLAGSEAAWQLARAGVPAILHEMRPVRGTDAHVTDGLAELVCSNSFRSDDAEFNAVGLLHEEMRRCDSLIIACGDRARVPAGAALAGRTAAGCVGPRSRSRHRGGRRFPWGGHGTGRSGSRRALSGDAA